MPPGGNDNAPGGLILVVDDDAQVRKLLQAALNRRGFGVLVASNGREALRLVFSDDPPDVRLIVSDVDMPEMSGVELVGVLSKYARSSRIPIIVMSAELPSPDAFESANVIGRLSKPFTLPRLLALIEASLMAAAV